MAKYMVLIPVTGYAEVEVETDDFSSVKELAWKMIDDGYEPVTTWEYCERVTTGNVCHAMLHEMDVYQIQDEKKKD